MDQKYDAITGESNASMDWNVEELNIVDLDDRLELADRCSGNNVAAAE
jgi:hypothetical protein